MSLEICCQCEGTTGRAGRGEDSLYTDNDWGPYCEDCWGDADYWRCLTEEKVSEIERLRQKSLDDDDEIMALKTALKNLQPRSVSEPPPEPES